MKRFAESRWAAAAVALGWAAAAVPLVCVAVRRAVAERAIAGASSFDEARRACAADAGNAECAARLAAAAERYGVNPLEFWDRAVELNRYDARVLIEAALAHEAAGEPDKAERLLNEAAGRSKTWLPRWSLANFHFRRGRPGEVAKWSRLALERGYGDRAPLFALCRAAGMTYTDILNQVVGTRDVAGIQAYMRFAGAEAGDAAGELARAAEMLMEAEGGVGISRQSGDELALASEALVRTGEYVRAWNVWGRLIGRGALGDVTGRDGGALLDVGFTGRAMAAPGFGWAMAAEEGAEVRAGSPPGTVKIELTGGQPERFPVLWQRVRLEEGGTWVLRFEASANGDRPADGHFHWALGREGDGAEAVRPVEAAGAVWSENALPWDVDGGFRRLSLEYRRPLGSARWSGELRIRNLSLRREGAPR